MMRITGGHLRGRKLITPKGQDVRPTKGRIREAIFSILASGHFCDRPSGQTRVLDLFAGTGALGFEALSRGNPFCLFMDESPASCALIRQNAEKLGLIGQYRIEKRDATRPGTRPDSAGPAFNTVFADPPYGKGLGEKAVSNALKGGWLTPDALIIIEEAKKSVFLAPSQFQELARRTYADTEIIILQPKAQGTPNIVS